MSKQIQYLSFSLLVTQTLFLLAPPSLASEPIAALISDRYQHLFASHLSWPGSNCSHPTPRQRSDLAALAVRLEDKTRSVVAFLKSLFFFERGDLAFLLLSSSSYSLSSSLNAFYHSDRFLLSKPILLTSSVQPPTDIRIN